MLVSLFSLQASAQTTTLRALSNGVRQLVEQERSCCAFLQFELHETADEVRLVVTVPPAAAEAVPDLLFELTRRHH